MKITTQRLILRPFQINDIEAAHQLFSCPEVMRFSLNGPYSKEKSTVFIKQNIQNSEANIPSLLAIIDRKSGLLIGSGGFFQQKILGQPELELGYRLLKSHWGKGFATEACLALKIHASNELGCGRLISIIEKENIASLRVAEKNGFKLEKELLYDGKIAVGIYAISL